MGAPRIERINRAVNDAFAAELDKAFKAAFKIESSTTWNVFLGETGLYVTTIKNGDALNPEQYAWVKAWADGYEAARDVLFAISQKNFRHG